MGGSPSQDRLWDRQVLISIFQKDPSAWPLIQSRSDWPTRRIGVSQLSVLQAAEWTGNADLAELLRTQGRLRDTQEACLSLDSEEGVDGRAHSPRCSPHLR